MTSFWIIPDISEIKTPLSILKEQADSLTEKTKGMLKGSVESISKDATIIVYLSIIVPSLNNYKYSVLRYQQPVSMYPGSISAHGRSYYVQDEDTFVSFLKDILADENTSNAIKGLLAQASSG